jgi:hypothetical protein
VTESEFQQSWEACLRSWIARAPAPTVEFLDDLIGLIEQRLKSVRAVGPRQPFYRSAPGLPPIHGRRR